VKKNDSTKSTADTDVSGGSRAAGGLGFQADATAFLLSHLLTGQRLGGLCTLIDDAPRAIHAETGGPGDDIRIELTDGRIVEAQVKRGLRKGPELWKALLALSQGVAKRSIDFGLLLVCPQASRTIIRELGRDLERLGDGVADSLSPIAKEWRAKLEAAGYPDEVCAKIRIVALAISEGQGEDRRVAMAHLQNILVDPGDALRAWEALTNDGDRLIEYRGRRTLETALRALTSRKIALQAPTQDGQPAPLLSRLLQWTIEANASYSVTGIEASLSIDRSWIRQHVKVLGAEEDGPTSFGDALEIYRSGREHFRSRARDGIDAETIGRFITRVVVLAGPGMGKSTLMSRLARGYAFDGHPVLKVRLRSLNERMHAKGETFDEALFAVGLDCSGIDPAKARAAGFGAWVVLLDGLDECGSARSAITRLVAEYAAAHPGYRIILTSRSIGYQRGDLAAWRHYGIQGLSSEHPQEPVQRLLASVAQSAKGSASPEQISTILKESPAAKTILKTPLLLGLATALALSQGSVGKTEAELYARIFRLVEAAATNRTQRGDLTNTELHRAIEVIGHALISNPEDTADAVLDRAAARLASDLGRTPLAARTRCEQAMRYWCDAGLLEELEFAGSSMLAFVHKTFGEYAAARFISKEPSDERSGLLQRMVTLQSDPVLEFAASLGLGREVYSILMQPGEAPDFETLLRALSLAPFAARDAVAEVASMLTRQAFQLLGKSGPEDAEQIGDALLAAAKAHPGLFDSDLSNHLGDPATDCGLVAWTMLLDSETADSNILDVANAVTRVIRLEEQRERSTSRRSGVRARPVGNANLERFSIAAMRRLVTEDPAPTDDLVIELCHLPNLGYVGFVQRSETLFLEKRRTDLHKATRSKWYGNDDESPMINFERIRDSMQASEVIQCAILAGDAAPDPRLDANYECSFLQMSAFRQITDWGKQPIGDGSHWLKGDLRMSEEAVLHAATFVGALDRERLSVEAASFLAIREEIKTYHTAVLFARTGDVDLPDVDWSAVPLEAIDLELFESALHHGSQYLVSIATHILDNAVISEIELCGLVSRTMATGTGAALWAAVNLAGRLSGADAVALALTRLETYTGRGAEYLPQIFEHHPIEMSEQLERAMRAALISNYSRLAVMAARMLHGLGDAPSSIRALLFEALEHWTKNPPPVVRGSSDPDPRPAIADSLAAVGNVTHAELAGFLAYGTDHDGKDTTRRLAKKRWKEDADFETAMHDAVRRGTLKKDVLQSLFNEAPDEKLH
jgi:hypothetical protein